MYTIVPISVFVLSRATALHLECSREDWYPGWSHKPVLVSSILTSAPNKRLTMLNKDDIWAANGHPKTSSLFKESCRWDDKPIMSLNGGDPTLPCLRDFFVPLVANDPTEVEFAEAVFNDLRYWLKLKEAKFMQPYLEEWRELADIKRKQMAFKALLDEVKTNGRSAATCARYIIEEPWKTSKSKKTEATKKRTTQKAVEPFSDDISRLQEQGYFN